jgi:uncharacterized membrane protein
MNGNILTTSVDKRLPWKFGLALVTVLLLSVWLISTPSGLLGKADAVGYAVCHRIDTRSFQFGDRQFSVCTRCTGQYLGALLGLIYQLGLGKRRAGSPSWTVFSVFGLFILAYAVDGLNSFIHLSPGLSPYYLYEPNNTLRLLTGTGMGLALSAAILPAFHQTVWKRWDSRPTLGGIRPMVGLIILSVGMVLLVLTENPIVLYPLSVISAIGVIVLLTMVYTLVWLMLLRFENRYESVGQLIFPLMGGFSSALLQIALFDLLRFLFTGTWSGFHIG